MSADSSSSTGSSGRSRPGLSDLSKETTEEDLWDLDEDHPGNNTPLPAARLTEPEEETPKTAEELAKAPAVSIRPIKTPSQSTGPKAVMIDSAPEKIVSPKIAKVPRPEVQRIKPSDTFDDLDDQDVSGAERSPVKAEAPVPAPPVEAAPSTIEDEEEPVTYVSFADEEEVGSSPTSSRESGTKRGWLKISSKELIGLGIFAFVMLLGAIWAITSFYGLIEIKKDPRALPKLPATGKFAAVAAQNSFWREPILQGNDRDIVQREVVILPVLELTLGSSSSTGALRIIFRDEKGRSIGDAITRSFSGGKFDTTGNATVTFPSTAGFEQIGSFNSYVSGMMDPWSVRVMEGPAAGAPADQFVPLVDIPISGFRH